MSGAICSHSLTKLTFSFLSFSQEFKNFRRKSCAVRSDLDHATHRLVETSGKVHLQRFNLLMDARFTNVEFLRCFRDTRMSCDSQKHFELVERHTVPIIA